MAVDWPKYGGGGGSKKKSLKVEVSNSYASQKLENARIPGAVAPPPPPPQMLRPCMCAMYYVHIHLQFKFYFISETANW